MSLRIGKKCNACLLLKKILFLSIYYDSYTILVETIFKNCNCYQELSVFSKNHSARCDNSYHEYKDIQSCKIFKAIQFLYSHHQLKTLHFHAFYFCYFL